MGEYIDDREWSDRFIPELRRLIGPYLLQPSTVDEDQHQATDLVVLKARDMTIACRVRRSEYRQRYIGQFTLRSRRDNGTKTEFRKIVEGWADWMFYGFHTGTGTAIAPWYLINLTTFRAHWIDEGWRKERRIKWGTVPNGDGTWFAWFQINTFPPAPPLLIASSDAVADVPPAPQMLTAADIPFQGTLFTWK